MEGICMKKRIIAAVMATLVGLSMVGCGSTSSDNSSQNKTDNTDSTAQIGGRIQLQILKKKTTGLILKQSQ